MVTRWGAFTSGAGHCYRLAGRVVSDALSSWGPTEWPPRSAVHPTWALQVPTKAEFPFYVGFGLDLQSSPADPTRFTLGQVSRSYGKKDFLLKGLATCMCGVWRWGAGSARRGCLQTPVNLDCTLCGPTSGGKACQT